MIYLLISTAYSLPILFSDSSQRKSRIQMAAGELGLPPNLLTLAAAHAWDIAGGLYAECMTAFLVHQGQVLDALTPEPQFTLGRYKRLGKAANQSRSRWSA